MPSALPSAFFAAGTVFTLLPSGGVADTVPCINAAGSAWSWRKVLDSGATQTAKTFYSGPASGSAATPSFRVIGTADLGSGTADNTTFLRGDGTWATASDSRITGSGTLALSTFTLTVPATGTAALLGTSNTFTPQQVFSFVGSASNNTTQDVIRIQPSGSLAANYRALAMYSTSGATAPAAYFDSSGVGYLPSFRLLQSGAATFQGVRVDGNDRVNFQTFNALYLVNGTQSNGYVTVTTTNSGTTGVIVYNNVVASVALAVKGAASQTGNLEEFWDSSFNILYRVNKAGYAIIKKTVAIADADLNASEVCLWLTDTIGATLLNIKGKDSGGTVRTATVPLL